MSRKTYTPDQKAAALAQIHLNGGNIQLTSIQFGIPDRTLYTWYRRWYAENQRRQPPSPPSPNPIPTFGDKFEALNYVRTKITDELVRLATDLESSSVNVSPYQRILMLAQLSDRSTKLDQHIERTRPVDPNDFFLEDEFGPDDYDKTS